jgi:hypothetical protein
MTIVFEAAENGYATIIAACPVDTARGVCNNS